MEEATGREPDWITNSDHHLTDNQQLTTLVDGLRPLQAIGAHGALIDVDAIPRNVSAELSLMFVPYGDTVRT